MLLDQVIVLLIIFACLFSFYTWPETQANWSRWLEFPSWRSSVTDPGLGLHPWYTPRTKYPTSYYSPVKRIGNLLLDPVYQECPNQPHNYPRASPLSYSFPFVDHTTI